MEDVFVLHKKDFSVSFVIKDVIEKKITSLSLLKDMFSWPNNQNIHIKMFTLRQKGADTHTQMHAH